MYTHLRRFFAAAILLSATLVARADTLLFTITEGPNTFTFDVPSNPYLGNGYDTDSVFLDGVSITENGVTTDRDYVEFAESDAGGDGADINSDTGTGVIFIKGPQLFTGTVNDPTFITGSFTGLTDIATGQPATITITDTSNITASVTPEPSSLILLGTGLLGMTGVVRRRYCGCSRSRVSV